MCVRWLLFLPKFLFSLLLKVVKAKCLCGGYICKHLPGSLLEATLSGKFYVALGVFSVEKVCQFKTSVGKLKNLPPSHKYDINRQLRLFCYRNSRLELEKAESKQEFSCGALEKDVLRQNSRADRAVLWFQRENCRVWRSESENKCVLVAARV